jgi:prepilin-type N-terminal cleavage/methylation domain-containing protein/prepilin-type processing-associated H-X9-DG protein
MKTKTAFFSINSPATRTAAPPTSAQTVRSPVRPPAFGFRNSRSAFTLTELLVVVAIIAILASLLLPALSRGIQHGRSIQCLGNLKQWGLAFHTYKDDHSDFIPREGHQRDGTVRRNNWAQVQDPANMDVWYNALPREMGLPGAQASNYASRLKGHRPLFYKNRLFHCPSAKFPAYVEKDNDAFFSIAMSSKLIGRNSALNEIWNGTIRYSIIQNPSDTVIFLDARVDKSEVKVHPFQLDTELGQPSAHATRFAARHTGGGTLAFADGRAQRVKGTDVVETRPGFQRGFAIFPGGSVIWCPDPFENPNE